VNLGTRGKDDHQYIPVVLAFALAAVVAGMLVGLSSFLGRAVFAARERGIPTRAACRFSAARASAFR